MLRRRLSIFLTLVIMSCSVGLVCSETRRIEELLPKGIPSGWMMREAPEIFGRETLFEHINGEADLFVQYGFGQSVFGIFRSVSSQDDKVDVDIYDMVNPLQAFGIFSRFRQSESPAGLGFDSYVKDRYVLFYKDRYFVMLQSTIQNDAILKQLAQDIESQIASDSAPPKEIAYFPKEGLKPGSVEYYPDGLLGHQFLKRGFKASYMIRPQDKQNDAESSFKPEAQLFLAIFDNPEQAAEAIRLFRDKLATKGKLTDDKLSRLGSNAIVGTDPYQGNVMATQNGRYLVGMTGYENAAQGERLVAEMLPELERHP